jgi:hypothetical protein
MMPARQYKTVPFSCCSKGRADARRSQGKDSFAGPDVILDLMIPARKEKGPRNPIKALFFRTFQVAEKRAIRECPLQMRALCHQDPIKT